MPDALRRSGADVVEVRLPQQLHGLDGLVVPGGESTTIMKLAAQYGLDDAIRAFDRPIFGTCAGMIVLDRGTSASPTSRSRGTRTGARSRASRPTSSSGR